MPAPPSLPVSSSRTALSPGDVVVGALLVLGLASVPAALAMQAPLWTLLAAPALLAGMAAAWFLLRHPLVNLVCVLALSVFTIGFKPGIQAEEVVYGLYYLLYLAGWFSMRLVVDRAPLVRSPGDRALLVFLGLAFGLTPLWLVLGAPEYVSAASAMILLAFYFPVRDAVERNPRGLRTIVGTLLFIAGYVAVRNLIDYRTLIADVVLADVLGGRRVWVNDAVLITGAVIGLTIATAHRNLWIAGAVGLVGVLCSAALVVTQSRMMWVLMVVAVVNVMGFGQPVQRRRLALAGAVGAVAAVLIGGSLLTGDMLVLAQAWLRRLSTLGSTGRDISFLSRIYESKGALAYIRTNPVLGHGLGVPYTYFDMLVQTTQTKTFIHNGYVSLVYRFGLWGTVLVPWFWSAAVLRGLRAFRRGGRIDAEAAWAGGAAAHVLVLMGVAMATANPLFNSDGVLMLALTMGVACGAEGRLQRAAQAGGAGETGRPHDGEPG